MDNRIQMISLLCFFLISTIEAQNKIYMYPLYGNISELFYYYTNIYIGTPGQIQSVIIDTGSSFVGVPCMNTCTDNCGSTHKDPFFDTNSSTTYIKDTCNNHSLSSCSCKNNRCSYYQVYSYNVRGMQKEVPIQDIMEVT